MIARWKTGLVAAALLHFSAAAHGVGGTVGTGTAASCTETNFNTVFERAEQ